MNIEGVLAQDLINAYGVRGGVFAIRIPSFVFLFCYN